MNKHKKRKIILKDYEGKVFAERILNEDGARDYPVTPGTIIYAPISATGHSKGYRFTMVACMIVGGPAENHEDEGEDWLGPSIYQEQRPEMRYEVDWLLDRDCSPKVKYSSLEDRIHRKQYHIRICDKYYELVKEMGGDRLEERTVGDTFLRVTLEPYLECEWSEGPTMMCKWTVESNTSNLSGDYCNRFEKAYYKIYESQEFEK